MEYAVQIPLEKLIRSDTSDSTVTYNDTHYNPYGDLIERQQSQQAIQ